MGEAMPWPKRFLEISETIKYPSQSYGKWREGPLVLA